MIISFLITAGLLTICYFFVRSETGKSAVLKTAAIATVFLHFSPLWVDFFTTGSAQVSSVMLLPIHPCNVCMWILLVLSCVKKKNTVAYRIASEGLFWVGTVCGFIGIFLNENFANNPTLADWEILKGLLSHSTMIFGTLYLLVGGFVKIRVFNIWGTASILLLFLLDGYIVNGLYTYFQLPAVNSMYLQQAPFPNLPWFTTPIMGIFGVLIVFIFTVLYEFLSLPKEERWYTKLKIIIDKGKRQY